MEVATATASTVWPYRRVQASPLASWRSIRHNRTLTFSSLSSPSNASLSTSLFCPSSAGGSVTGDFSGIKLRPECLNPSLISSSKGKRSVVTMVIPYTRGSAWEQPPPDLASYLFKNRIVYLGMSLVPSVTELILAEFLYLQYEDEEKPIYLYINSTGTTKGGEKLGYETEAFAVYDVMGS
uniref:ATP-dependent Clp protease proteolytic subunit n=1 Tax=Rhizophora mucronata TaxID=61149 RepID=A0A2P2J5B7_RHIMU